jgi:hypothetical protein
MTFDDIDETETQVAALAPPLLPDQEGSRALTPGEFMFYRNRGTFDGIDLRKWEPVVSTVLGHANCLCYRPRTNQAFIIRNGE